MELEWGHIPELDFFGSFGNDMISTPSLPRHWHSMYQAERALPHRYNPREEWYNQVYVSVCIHFFNVFQTVVVTTSEDFQASAGISLNTSERNR